MHLTLTPNTSILSEEAQAYIRARVRVNENGCWIWQQSLSMGYGHASWKRKQIKAHRLAYFAFVGEVPEGKELDHLCRERKCCNPEHLEPVTRRENLLRGETIPAENAKKTKCKRGHSLDDAYIIRGQRICRTCRLEQSRKQYRKKVSNDSSKAG